jgi:hypothetical protein
MRRAEFARLRRRELAWCVAGFVLAQAILAVAVDRYLLGVRDPEYARLRARLALLREHNPASPLFVFLGSSRTAAAFDAARLETASSGGRMLVFNYGVNGSGPMMEQVVLRRLIAGGERPAYVFLELMPMAISRRQGAPLEETQLDAARLGAVEVARLYRYYHQPYRLLCWWAAGRLLPTDRHQAELRSAVGLDGCRPPLLQPGDPLDDHGWFRHLPVHESSTLAEQFHRHLDRYAKPLLDGTPGDGPLRATADLLALCRREGVRAALVIPPEGPAFRAAYADHYSAVEAAMRRAAESAGVPLFDTRDWIDEAGFIDSHHLSMEGAARFTNRFGREVLGPILAGDPPPQWAAVHGVGQRQSSIGNR